MMKCKNIKDIRNDLDNGLVTSLALFKSSVDKALKYQSDYNCFVTILDNYEHIDNKNSLLNGVVYALKDNISTKGILTTASSNILKDYVPVYDATIYRKLKENGAVLMGKTVLDELAMGGTGTTAHTGIVRNPYDKRRMIGGSSAGSAACVALGVVPFAIGSDTGDSIRKPAAYGGVVGFKPSYGRISRYGLFPFASSLDHLGVLTTNVMDAAIVVDAVKGYDSKDMTSLKDDKIVYLDNLENDVRGRKLFYIKEILDINSDNEELCEIVNNFKEVISKCESLGMEVFPVSMDINLLKAIYPAYITISCAEATSNNANLTGIIFGSRSDKENINEMMMDARTNGFSELIKRRFILGSYILQKENQEKLYLNACRVRRMITSCMNEFFKEYDGLILPAESSVAPLFDVDKDRLSDEYLILDNHLAIGNFGGYPSITIPSGFVNNMPIGINITGKFGDDSLVLNIACKLEGTMDYKQMIVGDDDV